MLTGFDYFLYGIFQYTIIEWNKTFTKVTLNEALILLFKIWITWLIFKALYKGILKGYIKEIKKTYFTSKDENIQK